MAKLSDLARSGSAGFSFRMPGKPEEPAMAQAVVPDPERRVLWLFTHSPFPVDLRDVFDAELRSDLTRQARASFDAAKEPDPGVPAGAKSVVEQKTEEPPLWPIVDLERVMVGGAKAVRIVERIMMRRGREVIAARLQVPLAHGALHAVAMAESRQTGLRESTLAIAAAPKGEPTSSLPRAEYDDPKHDAAFPQHPLSCVRGAIAWLLASKGGALAITAPRVELPVGEVVVGKHACALVPPPRCLAVDAATDKRFAVRMFARTLLSDDQTRAFDVLRKPKLDAAPTPEALIELAGDDIDAWEREGASGIERTSKVVDGAEGCVEVETTVTFAVGKKRSHSVTRWRAYPDGHRVRLSASAPPYVAHAELADELAASMKTLRLVDPG
ncbi:MAG TPA: hypothetical protein VGM56_33180 [Byssovorax sp.]